MKQARQETQKLAKKNEYDVFNEVSDLLHPWRPAYGTLADAAKAITGSSTLNRDAVKKMVKNTPQSPWLTVAQVFYDENNQILCPACLRERDEEVTHVHFESPIQIDGNEKYEATAMVSGDVLAIPCTSWQCGHQWLICLGEQEGRLELFSIINEGWIAEIFSEKE